MPCQSTSKNTLIQHPASPAEKVRTYVGIDVGASWLDVCIRPENGAEDHSFRVANDPSGCKKIGRALKKVTVACVVCEATGKLERLIVRCLGQQGLPVAVLNPAQSVNFRKACGKIAKTDKLDAALLARFGQVMQPVSRPLPDEQVLALRELVVRRRQLVTSHTAESNRSLRTESLLAKRQIMVLLRLLDRQIKELDKALQAQIAAFPEFRAKVDLLLSIPGIGPVVALTLVAELPELGAIQDGALSALVGLAPMNNDSGQRLRRAKCKGGRKSVRTVLYLAAMAARRFNKPIAAFYERLVARGKPKLVALNAAMRKLLLIANHIMASGKPWVELPSA